MFTHRHQGHHHEEEKEQHIPHLQQQHEARGEGPAGPAGLFCCLIVTKVLWRNWNTQNSVQVNDLFIKIKKERIENPHSEDAVRLLSPFNGF